MYQRKYTPEAITELQENEVFVFGSNEGGLHMGGAANVAYHKFGACWGEGKGHHGQSYAIPTLDSKLGKITRTELKKNIAEFVSYVLMNQNLTFYLTKIGCGIAGWDIEDVKELFWQAIEEESTEEASEQSLPANLVIPQEFML